MADKEYEGIKFEDYWSGGDTYSRGSYKESDVVTGAKTALDTMIAQKPAAYTSQWQTQLSDTIGKIANRDKFSYDVNGDALYQQYKDKYIQQGKMAMQDTMGQAAAMTGGYGNSYAATVGNQAYQAQLNNLNDVVPELYQMAYDRYNQETQDLYNQYSLYADRDNTDYGRHRDTVSDWQTDRNYLANRFDSERNFDYGKYSDAESANQAQFNADRESAYSQYINDYNNAYNAYRDSVADEQWQATYDMAKAEHDVDMKNNGYKIDDETGKYVPDESANDTTVDGFAEADARYGKKLAGYTTKQGQADYLASLGLDDEVAFALLDKYGVTELTDRTWEMVDDGGINWFGLGIDANAKVSDGTKTYTLAELRKELKKTMSNKEANAWIKDLEDKLGI
jgi:hypothetical protein